MRLVVHRDETRKLSVAGSSPTTYAGQTGMYWPGATPNR
jgi:hypothetical protein